jgi:hypothetical protein
MSHTQMNGIYFVTGTKFRFLSWNRNKYCVLQINSSLEEQFKKWLPSEWIYFTQTGKYVSTHCKPQLFKTRIQFHYICNSTNTINSLTYVMKIYS